MTSETDHPRQRTVAELLAQYGDGAATGRRRRRRAAEDPEDGAAAEVVDLVGTPAPERRPGTLPEPARSVSEGSAAPDVVDQPPSGNGSAGRPNPDVAIGADRADAPPTDVGSTDDGRVGSSRLGRGRTQNGHAGNGHPGESIGAPSADGGRTAAERSGADEEAVDAHPADRSAAGRDIGDRPTAERSGTDQEAADREVPDQAPTDQAAIDQAAPEQAAIDQAATDQVRADRVPADRTRDGRSGREWTGARTGGEPTEAALGAALFDRRRPADGGPSPATDQLPRVRTGSSTRPDPSLTGPIRRRPTGSGPVELGDPAEEQTLFGVPTAAGSAPAAASARQWALGAPDRAADGGPATRDAGRFGHPGGIDHPDGIDRHGVDEVDGDGIDTYGADEHEVDERGPAGLDGADEPQRRLGRAAAASSGQAWATVLAQWIVGALGGAVLWVGFRFLWRSLPVVALAAAVLITVGLVVVVRALLRNDDTRTTMFAVLVGLLLTVSPAILVLLDR